MDTSWRHLSSLQAGPPTPGPGGRGRYREDPAAGTVPGACARALARSRGNLPTLAPLRISSHALLPAPSQVAESRVGKPAIRGGKMIIDHEIFTSAGTLLLGSENTTWKEAQTYCHRRGIVRAVVSACVVKCVCHTPRLLAHVVASSIVSLKKENAPDYTTFAY
jgi:hypothetical protein